MSGMNKMSDKVCFVSVDVESYFPKGESFQGVENLDKILSIFKKYNILATLFVTGKVLGKYGDLVKAWSKNYEIACHSFSHRFWDTLNLAERKEEIENFFALYKTIFDKRPIGFRAPSHLIDEDGFKLLKEKGFLYDSSIIPHYPFLKNYRGYKGKAPTLPYWLSKKLLEIPVTGQIFGIPLAGTWISKMPLFVYNFLFLISSPVFLTFNLHSWDSLNFKLLEKIEEILKLLKNKNYRFLTGEQIYASISKNRE